MYSLLDDNIVLLCMKNVEKCHYLTDVFFDFRNFYRSTFFSDVFTVNLYIEMAIALRKRPMDTCFFEVPHTSMESIRCTSFEIKKEFIN